ncbi:MULTISPECIES: MDR family oxidoreductase [unclassified Leifsonia]|uniref:MDR family oxidoreductase n=1 Tax=unclassified Leifsonia TaxID=2663824 RepID=UPI0006F6BF05|nr:MULTISPECIES: MDR family oxidoreductase [unclassified Leifsonia]KQX05230.1 NADPH:quinone dehydrogenase [Leifsonia sp. Root1293]KRA08863.1 NADPH:quinone dehydrogenase [Leifsonia sp. Root60]
MGDAKRFRAIVVDRETDGADKPRLGSALRELSLDDLRTGDSAPDAADAVELEVSYSSLNYKDGLAVAGRPGVTRSYPIVAGIDVVGTVVDSADSRWAPGDRVLLNGGGLSETRHGGYTERAVIPGASLVRVPAPLTDRQAAAIGTAGFTAMLSVLALERHGVSPTDGPVLVTGASGGVGSVAITLLARAGFEVTAVTGRAADNGDYLRTLGAAALIDRAELAESGKPLQSQRWAAAIDSVGGVPLANVLAQVQYGGVVAACGLAASADLPTTVLPFILRAVSLVGVNSVEAPLSLREEAWGRLATDLDLAQLDGMTSEIGLDDVFTAADDILDGRTRGRTVVAIGSGALAGSDHSDSRR